MQKVSIVEQTIIELGLQLTELTAEIESWKFWLSLIVGIVAFVVAIGCAIIPIYAKSGVRKGIIEGTQQAMDELKEQELLQKRTRGNASLNVFVSGKIACYGNNMEAGSVIFGEVVFSAAN